MTWQVGGLPPSFHSGKFGAFRSCRNEDETFIICHVTLSDHVINGHITLLVGAPYPKSPLFLV